MYCDGGINLKIAIDKFKTCVDTCILYLNLSKPTIKQTHSQLDPCS